MFRLRFGPLGIAVLLPVLLMLATCGKDSPTRPTEPEPPPAPPPPAPVATKIEVTPSSATLMSIGQTVQLTARVLDQNNNPMTGATVTWTSSAVGVATVSAQGLVTAVSNGVARITARSGNVSAGIDVAVMQSAGRIVIDPESATLMSIGETVQLTAAVLDGNGRPVADAVVTWTSGDESVATVSAQGLVTAIKNGIARITARSGNATAGIDVTVMQSAGRVVIDPESATLMSIGETVQLTAAVLDGNGRPVADAVVTWTSSDESVATVSAQGLVTAVNIGTARITARSGNAMDGIDVTVMLSVSSIVIEPAEVTLPYIGATVQLAATALNQDERPVPGAVVTWESSDESVATVDAQGLVTAVMNGVARITARSGDVQHSIVVAVEVLTPNSERDVLVLLYHRLGGPEWNSDTNWLSAEPIGDWHGVGTDAHGYVIGLSLPHNGLKGTIPVQLARLTGLTRLALNGNQLTGEIPPELGLLSSVNHLDLSENELTGSIPGELGDIEKLFVLNLSENNLTGSIPPELGQVGLLTGFRSEPLYRAEFNLGSNQLTGPIPPELGNLVNVHVFSLSRNALTGGIPAELGNLNQVTVLDLNDNQLTGGIPRSSATWRSFSICGFSLTNLYRDLCRSR